MVKGETLHRKEHIFKKSYFLLIRQILYPVQLACVYVMLKGE